MVILRERADTMAACMVKFDHYGMVISERKEGRGAFYLIIF